MIDIAAVKLVDILPSSIKHDVDVVNAAGALDNLNNQIAGIIPSLFFVGNVDHISGAWLDALAWQWQAPYYDQTLPIEQKREIVTRSLSWHKRKGTPSAVEELVTTIFGSGEVQEWWEYGGQPGYFKVRTNDPSATADKATEFLAAINSVKNERSWLEKIEIITEGTMRIYYGVATHVGDQIIARQVV
ncbi:phage tail protein I [Paenibacillus camelliae]|uniref:phage tail protein I n=1 Tax=Paenibacillus camelliae TaxID=512410 RepID=UPI00203BB18F|nr:phage tail protein I [Paenibacillus camelliae]MCM3632924.1 phage tail protein I [Paenibacillus camelliae]